MTDQYELLVIGAGAAGSSAATTAAKAGRRVALVERDRLGGTCLNYGCDPTKTLLHVARLLRRSKTASRYGLEIEGAMVNWPAVQAWVDQVQRTIRGGTPEEARAGMARMGIDLYMGEAHFTSPHTARVGSNEVRAERIIIATGGRAEAPPIEGLEEAGYITNVEAVSLNPLPGRLAIIGAGPIGIEFAQLFHRFGVEVTVLEISSTLLSRDDREMAERLCSLLATEGIRMHTGVRAQEARCENVATGKRLRFAGVQFGGDSEKGATIEVDEILVATGRRPALEALAPEVAGVRTNEDGIIVDSTLRSSVSHIWAAGDVTGGAQFTHVASEQGKLAAHNAFAEEARPFEPGAIPWVTCTEPELAHVGKTEEELRRAEIPFRTLRLPLEEVDRARIQGETEGMIKLLVDEEGRLLGGHILAPHAGDLLAPVVLAMAHGLTARQVAETLLPYPTLAEGVRWAAERFD